MTFHEAAIRFAAPCLLLALAHIALSRAVADQDIPQFLRRRRHLMDTISPYLAAASLLVLLAAVAGR